VTRPLPYEMVKAAILDGTFEPGAPLVEAELARWCGVSRTPVREALSRLEHDGMIERRARGFVVRRRTPAEIADVCEVRGILESTAARLAARRHTPADRMRLVRALERAGDATADLSPGDLMTIDRDLHRAVWLASHSPTLVDLLERLLLHLGRPPSPAVGPDRFAAAQVEHARLVEAVLARDADGAAEAAARHFAAAAARLAADEPEPPHRRR
jgi:DNA-binding GntR family transcriptional regulator